MVRPARLAIESEGSLWQENQAGATNPGMWLQMFCYLYLSTALGENPTKYPPCIVPPQPPPPTKGRRSGLTHSNIPSRMSCAKRDREFKLDHQQVARPDFSRDKRDLITAIPKSTGIVLFFFHALNICCSLWCVQHCAISIMGWEVAGRGHHKDGLAVDLI